MPVFGGWQRERTKAGIVAQWDEKRVTVDGEQSSNRPEGTTVHRHLGQLRGVCNLAEMRGDARSPETGRANVPNTDRTRDLTPTKAVLGANGKPVAAFTNSGGGTNFLKFLKSELIPHIDSTLRTDPYRVLVGHSLGGLTALDALYTMPDVFNAYVAIDPSLWWDNQVLLTRAKDYFSKPAPSARALFVGQANTLVAGDTAPNTHFLSIGEFNRLVESENRSGIRYAYK